MEGCRSNGNLRKNGIPSRGGPAVVRRTITVHASSELACKPDLFSLSVSISSTKEDAEAAQTSVKRRSEYVLQVLRNNGVKEKNVEKSTDVSRVCEDEVRVRTDLVAQTESLQACETARNVLVTKMDSTVQCSAVEPLHSPPHRAEKRRQVFQQAVANASQKASSIALLLGVQLGPALEVEETTNYDCIIRGASPNESTDQPDPQSLLVTSQSSEHHHKLSSHSLHERVRASTETYTASLRVKFEVSPLRTCHHRSCPKH